MAGGKGGGRENEANAYLFCLFLMSSFLFGSIMMHHFAARCFLCFILCYDLLHESVYVFDHYTIYCTLQYGIRLLFSLSHFMRIFSARDFQTPIQAPRPLHPITPPDSC